jgi:hypothetical protein
MAIKVTEKTLRVTFDVTFRSYKSKEHLAFILSKEVSNKLLNHWPEDNEYESLLDVKMVGFCK